MGARQASGHRFYGVVDIGPFKADIKFANGIWQFRPLYTNNPQHTAAVHMNTLIRDIGYVWTPVPDDEVESLKKELTRLGRLKDAES